VQDAPVRSIDPNDPMLDGPQLVIPTRAGVVRVSRRRWLQRFGELELVASLAAASLLQTYSGEALRAALLASRHFRDREHALRISVEVMEFLDELVSEGAVH
jgi:hypothetical protein